MTRETEYQYVIGKTKLFLAKEPTCDRVDEYVDFLLTQRLSAVALSFREMNWIHNVDHYNAVRIYRYNDINNLMTKVRAMILDIVWDIGIKQNPDKRNRPHGDFLNILDGLFWLTDL